MTNRKTLFFNLNAINSLLASSILIGILIVFLLQPMFGDDVIGMRTIQRFGGGLTAYVSELHQSWTGRIPQLLLIWLGLHSSLARIGFQIASFFTLLTTLWIMTALPLGRWPRILGQDQFFCLIAITAIWFGIPGINETVFWSTGATAYLYSGLFLLLFLLPYVWVLLESPFIHQVILSSRVAFSIVLFSLGAMAGCCHEQVAFTLLIFVIAWLWLCHRQEILNRTLWPFYVGMAGLVFGIVVLVIAPGNWVRFAIEPVAKLSMSKKIKYGLFDIHAYLLTPQLQGWLFMMLLCAGFGAMSATKKSPIRLQLAALFLAFAFLSLIPTMGLNIFFSNRTFYFSILYLVMGVSCIFVHFDGGGILSKLLRQIMCTGLLLLLFCDMVVSSLSAYQLFYSVKKREKSIAKQKANGIEDVRVSPLPQPFGRLVFQYDPIDADPIAFGFDYNHEGELQLISPFLAATWTYPYGYAPKTLIEQMMIRIYKLKDASQISKEYSILTNKYSAELYGVRSLSLRKFLNPLHQPHKDLDPGFHQGLSTNTPP